MIALGRAGIELAPHPTDADRLLFRPPALPTKTLEDLRLHKASILALLRPRAASSPPRALEPEQIARRRAAGAPLDGPVCLLDEALSVFAARGITLRFVVSQSCERIDPESAYVRDERLGVAMDLALPTAPGSPAWLIAVGESLAALGAMAPVPCGASGVREQRDAVRRAAERSESARHRHGPARVGAETHQRREQDSARATGRG